METKNQSGERLQGRPNNKRRGYRTASRHQQKIDEVNLQIQAVTGKFISLEQFRLLYSAFDLRKLHILSIEKKREIIRRFITRVDGDEDGLSVEFSIPVNGGKPVRIPIPKVVSKQRHEWSGRILQMPFEDVEGLNRRQLIERIHEIVSNGGNKGNANIFAK